MKLKRAKVVKPVPAEDPVSTARAAKVKDAMLLAWSSYEKFAWGFDELQVEENEFLYLSFPNHSL